jgi:hypothetical protein
MAISSTGLAMVDASVSLGGIAYTGGKHLVQYQGSQDPAAKTVRCKGLYATADATVVVHPIKNRDGQNITCKLTAGIPFGIAFDHVVEAGTDAVLTAVSAIPLED